MALRRSCVSPWQHHGTPAAASQMGDMQSLRSVASFLRPHICHCCPFSSLLSLRRDASPSIAQEDDVGSPPPSHPDVGRMAHVHTRFKGGAHGMPIDVYFQQPTAEWIRRGWMLVTTSQSRGWPSCGWLHRSGLLPSTQQTFTPSHRTHPSRQRPHSSTRVVHVDTDGPARFARRIQTAVWQRDGSADSGSPANSISRRAVRGGMTWWAIPLVVEIDMADERGIPLIGFIGGARRDCFIIRGLSESLREPWRPGAMWTSEGAPRLTVKLCRDCVVAVIGLEGFRPTGGEVRR